MAKLNLKYYKGEDLYSDGPIENEIIEYIKNTQEKDYENIFEKDNRWPVFYHLTPLRKNVLNWYPFEKNSKILEIGAGMGAITGALLPDASLVTCVELSKNRATAIQNRYKDADNLEIIVGNLNDVELDEKYDYITLIGVLEYAKSFTDTKNPYQDFLNKIKKYLKPNGKILIAIENKFGMKYWAGSKEDHTGIPYDGITGYKNSSHVNTFGKNELKRLLENVGFKNINFYYPLPDYKIPNIIFSDNYLPNRKDFNRYFTYETTNSYLSFDERVAYKEVSKEDKKHFSFFANSYIVEVSNDNIKSDLQYVAYNNHRKNKYRLMTKLTEKLVEKTPLINSEDHFKTIKKNIDLLNQENINIIDYYDETKIKSDFIKNAITLEEKLVDNARKNDIDKFYKEIDKYYKFISQNSIQLKNVEDTFYKKYEDVEIKENDKEKFLSIGFIDLTFKNIFLQGGEYLIFDQEWDEENVSVEYILFRSIYDLFNGNYISEKTISLDDVLSKYDLLDRKEMFIKIEESFQKEVIDKEMISVYLANKNTSDNLVVNHAKLQEENNFLHECVQKHEKELYEAKEELKEIKNLRVWPVIKKYIEKRRK